jgi:hypothetical protein
MSEPAPPTLPQFAASPLSTLFFCASNMEALQQGVRYGVYKASGGQVVIGRQSDDELLIVMRSIYLQHAQNRPGDVVEQVRELNARVLDFAVPRVAIEVQQHRKHLSEVTVNPVPLLDRAQSVSQKGMRVLEQRQLL